MVGVGFNVDERIVCPSALVLASMKGTAKQDSLDLTIPFFPPFSFSLKATGLRLAPGVTPQEGPLKHLEKSEDLRQIESEWERYWKFDQPSHLTDERSHGAIGEGTEAEKQATDLEFFGTPLPRIVADFLRGQGMNLYLEKPPVREEESGEKQETSRRFIQMEKKNHEIEEILEKQVSVNWQNVPLQQVVEDLRKMFSLDVCIDEKALSEKRISLDQPVTMELDQLRLKSVLTLILRSINLHYFINDGCVQITTWERTPGARMQVATHAAADLVLPRNSPRWEKGCTHWLPSASSSTRPKTLIQFVKTVVRPNSWAERGGPGTIVYNSLTMSLIVNQSRDIQEEIVDLLAALRRLEDSVPHEGR